MSAFVRTAAAMTAIVLLLCTGAQASCGSASCPIDVRFADWTEKGVIRLDYSEEYINQNEPKIGTKQASVGQVRGHHDEVYTLNQTRRVAMEIGLASRWSVQAILPFVHREHQHVHHHQGADVNESWNFNGVGNLTLLNRFAVRRPPSREGTTLQVIAGGVLPTGRDIVVNDDGDAAEEGIVPGVNAWSAILGGAASRPFTARTLNGKFSEMPVFFSTTYQWNFKNPRNDYRIGDLWQANAGLSYPLLPKLAISQQVNLKVNARDEAGTTGEEVEKTGGTFVYYTPGIQITLADGLWTYVHLQVPVYQRVNSIQLTSDYNLLMGLSYRFNAL